MLKKKLVRNFFFKTINMTCDLCTIKVMSIMNPCEKKKMSNNTL